MGEDFLGFLSNIVQVFPSFAHRPLYLTGEVSTNTKLLTVYIHGVCCLHRVMLVCSARATGNGAHEIFRDVHTIHHQNILLRAKPACPPSQVCYWRRVAVLIIHADL